MKTFLILAEMDAQVLAKSGNIYDNFQFMGYVEAETHKEAIYRFFDQPQFPLDWADVRYLWSESLEDSEENAHYGELNKIATASLLGDARR